MSNYPSELRYAKSHEWLRDDGNGLYTVGITEHAQELLGDLVYVELPEVGAELNAGDSAGVVESVKAASDIYAPVSGEVVAVNETLADAPEKVNKEPFKGGWLFKIKISEEAELDDLLDADGYAEHVDSGE
ncbi:glycine cleavage system protein GcvH [Permianibacter aggregans]|uniref:Glycine cleavage system H protein n=1 Tax=Permianibacter aggregans TaxID=1510150 RepID=A0A4R6UDR4_9GAMM|nr:glycine cleavage system protein GcvH [Permianibacter aggregans]QGX40324.1 glycine cleavage system protein GcvH [Permianibacter aggregans]TDQ44242.1 glycine cleavage system H protein [Permianibacter aggregans]